MFTRSPENISCRLFFVCNATEKNSQRFKKAGPSLKEGVVLYIST